MINYLWCSSFFWNYSLAEKWQLFKSYIMIISDIDIPEPLNSSFLHLAAKSGDVELLKKVINNDPIDINLQDKNGWTALHIACYLENLEMVKFLVDECGADLNIAFKSELDDNRDAISIVESQLDEDLTVYLIDKGCKLANLSLKIHSERNTEDYLRKLLTHYNDNKEMPIELIEVIKAYNLRANVNGKFFTNVHIFEKINVPNLHTLSTTPLIGEDQQEY